MNGFRPVGDNPYLLLIDDFEEEGGKEITTELGVIAEESRPIVQQSTSLEENKEIMRSSTGNFSLGGDEILDVVELEKQDSEKSNTPTAEVGDDQTINVWQNSSPRNDA